MGDRGWYNKFGRYAVIRVPGSDVTQRLRWIEPGSFSIGSRSAWPDNEAPQVDVTFADGFWLFDTPVTQELWQAVMGDNPSLFRSPNRPVERVSHDEAQTFIVRLNDRIPGVRLSLPSEAEWEYACSAGTTEATYRGNLWKAGALDVIAWYIGNSHDGFELDNGIDAARWTDKPEDRVPAGTRPVALKVPNAWGLYDTRGRKL